MAEGVEQQNKNKLGMIFDDSNNDGTEQISENTEKHECVKDKNEILQINEQEKKNIENISNNFLKNTNNSSSSTDTDVLKNGLSSLSQSSIYNSYNSCSNNNSDFTLQQNEQLQLNEISFSTSLHSTEFFNYEKNNDYKSFEKSFNNIIQDRLTHKNIGENKCKGGNDDENVVIEDKISDVNKIVGNKKCNNAIDGISSNCSQMKENEVEVNKDNFLKNIEVAEKMAAFHMSVMQQWQWHFSLLCMQHAYYNIEKDVTFMLKKNEVNHTKKKDFSKKPKSETGRVKKNKNWKKKKVAANIFLGEEAEDDEHAKSENADVDEEGFLLSGETEIEDCVSSLSSPHSSSSDISMSSNYDDNNDFDFSNSQHIKVEEEVIRRNGQNTERVSMKNTDDSCIAKVTFEVTGVSRELLQAQWRDCYYDTCTEDSNDDEEKAEERRNNGRHARRPIPQHGIYPRERRLDDNPWERYDVGLFAKLLLVMFLFDAMREMYLFLVLSFVLHVHGFFDPLLDWIAFNSHEHESGLSLEQTISNLRRRHQLRMAREFIEREEKLLADSLSELCGNSSSESANSSSTIVNESNPLNNIEDGNKINSTLQKSSTIDKSTSSASSASLYSSSIFSSSSASQSSFSSSSILSSSNSMSSTSSSTCAQQSETVNFYTRFVYQSLVMFFMTLMPWWNPNPKYLEE